MDKPFRERQLKFHLQRDHGGVPQLRREKLLYRLRVWHWTLELHLELGSSGSLVAAPHGDKLLGPGNSSDNPEQLECFADLKHANRPGH